MAVKIVNAFKAGGAEALVNLELYKKVENAVEKVIITIGLIKQVEILK